MNLRYATLAVSTGILFCVQPYRPYVVWGTSMSPTFASGQLLLGDAHPHRIVRGDVVVFRHEGETMIKRVAYLAGDRIERYRFVGEWQIPTNEKMRTAMVRKRLTRHDLVVPPGSVYVVGDNYKESVDSRTYGAVPLAEVIALVPKAGPCRNPWNAPAHETGRLVARL